MSTPPDLTAPVVMPPNSITLAGSTANGGISATSASIAAFLNGASAFDAVDGSVTVTNNAPGLFANGTTTTVTFSATDAANNTGTTIATVTVNDPVATGGNAPAPSGTGLTIDQSIAVGLDPNATTTDTDGDGVPDIVEIGDPANPNDVDADGVLDLFESGASAGDSSIASGLPVIDGSVSLSSAGQVLSAVSHRQVSGDPVPGVSFPQGVIDYYTTVTTPGASQVVFLTFSSALPTGFEMYKVSAAGVYSPWPTGQWSKVDRFTVSLTLTDGDSQTDLDGLVNGVIVDPVAVGVTNPVTPPVTTPTTPPTTTPADGGGGGGGCLAPSMELFSTGNIPLVLIMVGIWLALRKRSREGFSQ